MAIPKIPSYDVEGLMVHLQGNRVNWDLDPERSILLVHDMQEYFVKIYESPSPIMDRVINNIAKIKDWCKQNSVPVVYSAQPVDQRPEDRALLTDFWGEGLKSGQELEKITERLAPENSELLLKKWRYSAFQRTSLHQLMHEDKRDQLIIVGIYGHIGILATALEAFMTDIQVFAVGDAIGDFTEEQHTWALNYIATRCGMVCDTNSIVSLNSDGRIKSDSIELMCGDIGRMIGLDKAISPDDNIFDYGLDSVRLMQLIENWQSVGLRVDFESIAQCSTVNEICDIALFNEADNVA